MRIFILLACFMFAGVLGERSIGRMFINNIQFTDRYPYFANTQALVACRTRYFESANITLKFTPKDGPPIISTLDNNANGMDIKLTPQHHNSTIECHMSLHGKELTTAVKFENIETLQAQGLHADEEYRGFVVNGLKLVNEAHGRGPTGDPYIDVAYHPYDGEPLTIDFWKGYGFNTSCQFREEIEFDSYSNDTYKMIYKEANSTVHLICTAEFDGTRSWETMETHHLHLLPHRGEATIKGISDSDRIISFIKDNDMEMSQGSKKHSQIIVVEYRTHSLYCLYGWCYDESQLECPERTEEDKTPKMCTFILKDGCTESTIKCSGPNTTIDTYIQLRDPHALRSV